MEGETSSRRFCSRHRGASRLYGQVVGQTAVRWLLLLSLLVTLFSSSHHYQLDSSSYFLTKAWALNVTLDASSLSASSSASIQENTLPSPHTVTTAPSSQSIPIVYPAPQAPLTQTEVPTREKVVQLATVVPTKVFSKKESEDDATAYRIGMMTLNSLAAKGDRSVTSSSAGAEEEPKKFVGGLSDYDRLFAEYSAPLSTMRCQSTDAYCPSSAPICCGWLGGFYCIRGGHKCCGGQLNMTGELYCQQSESCCTVGNKSICCPKKTQCSRTLKRQNSSRFLSARNSPSENEVLSTNDFRSESDTDDSNANETTDDEVLVEVPVCIPSFPQCASHQTQDACVAVNGVDAFSSRLKCGWCCEEQRCITVSESSLKAESVVEKTDRSVESLSIAAKSTHEMLDSSIIYFESEREDVTSESNNYENASCFGGKKPLTSLEERCSSNCEYYSTCTHCVSSRLQQTTASTSSNAFVRSTVSYLLGMITTQSNTSSGLTTSGEKHALKEVEFGVDESCIWCLSTAQCISGREYSTCPNAQFAVVEDVCAYSWYEPKLSRRWGQVVLSILKVIFLVSIIIFLVLCYQQHKETQRREEELNVWNLSRLSPQDAVRRYGFSLSSRPESYASGVRTNPDACAAQPVCQGCGIAIFFDVHSDGGFTTILEQETEPTPFKMEKKEDKQVNVAAHTMDHPHGASSIPSSQEGSSQEHMSGPLHGGVPAASPPPEAEAPNPEAVESSTAKQKDYKDEEPGVPPFSSSTGDWVEGGMEKESKGDTKENEEEGESRFVALLPCTHIFCAACIEELVQDSHSFRFVQYLRSQWRRLQWKWKWRQPQHRASHRRRPRLPLSDFPSSPTHATPNTEMPRSGDMVPTIAENGAASSSTTVAPINTKEESKWLSPVIGIMDRVRKSFSQVESEKTPLLTPQSEDNELDEFRSAQMKERGGDEDGEAPFLEEREVGSSDATRTVLSQDRPFPGSLPISSSLTVRERASFTPAVEAVTVVHESTIPPLNELQEALHHECPYCCKKVEHIFFADRLRRI